MISIIVSFYNQEKHLERYLESVISQTYHDIEVIIVNDGSTDNSLNIPKRFSNKDNMIKILNKINEGVALQEGME